MEEYSQQPLAPFWINPDIATAVVVAINILSLSDGVPYLSVTRKRGPVVDVNACVATLARIPSRIMAVIELQSMARAIVIHPGGGTCEAAQSWACGSHVLPT